MPEGRFMVQKHQFPSLSSLFYKMVYGVLFGSQTSSIFPCSVSPFLIQSVDCILVLSQSFYSFTASRCTLLQENKFSTVLLLSQNGIWWRFFKHITTQLLLPILSSTLFVRINFQILIQLYPAYFKCHSNVAFQCFFSVMIWKGKIESQIVTIVTHNRSLFSKVLFKLKILHHVLSIKNVNLNLIIYM